MELIEALNWRYATKRMNGGKVPEEKVNRILEAIQLAPTSFGLQPFSVIVVESEPMKKKIGEKSNPQPQIMEGSHLLIFASWNQVNDEHIEHYIRDIATKRGIDQEALNGLKSMMQQFIKQKDAETIKNWTARQAYIAFGIGLVAAAVENVDATPMEGFDKNAMDELLGLREKGLSSSVMITLGYRDPENDDLAAAPKVRRPKEELFLKV